MQNLKDKGGALRRIYLLGLRYTSYRYFIQNLNSCLISKLFYRS